ncbi:mannonate dehydratase [Ensifer sp. ENS09]|uniref:mannonate dehydratase n=1 Tax=Ensifer sp. ENS09 TaxID=2769263 RepID=UPI00177D8ED7|nr:mannonate dehydratase [Ensifer sp. ENS09]MBD9652678.1 mannonate dehydratase [Ensifer sp. ENS09]
MEECFRWYGPNDPVPLSHIRQAGATGIVSALHHIYDGSPWSDEAIQKQKALIEAAGMRWSVVESIPVHNSIKLATSDSARYIGWYKDTLRALARAGIDIVCYNFMPVVDWTRTELVQPLPNGGYALRFDAVDFAAYDLFVLKRPRVEDSYSERQIFVARQRFDQMDQAKIDRIERNLIAGLPATERQFNRASFLAALAEYDGVTADALHDNLARFLKEIVPVAEEVGIRLCIHPDDPAFSLYGLPRIVSTPADVRRILSAVDSPANGITFCTGSYGTRADNDLPAMVREFGPRIHFAHLRNVQREEDGSFYEADHLGGSSDMPAVILALMEEQERRVREGRTDWQIPLRPDHGHLLADDIGKERINPGYSLIGRLKGLAEIRGVMQGIATAMAHKA